MKLKITTIVLLTMVLAQSCTNSKSSILWVSGLKTPCSSGAGKMECLNVYKGEDINNPQWENFYAQINGFEFEEGVMKKIKVKEVRLPNDKVPADASSISYTMVEELENQPDNRVKMKGNWILAKINGGPINRMVDVPVLEVDLSMMRVSGNAGCNLYNGQIEKLTGSNIQLSKIASTRKACINKNIENDYLSAFDSIVSYQADDATLRFLDKDGKELLSFIKKNENEVNRNLHDVWVAVRIDGNPINRMAAVPRMEINLTEMRVSGNDGCNEYTGKINEATAKSLEFGNLAVTKKMCMNMETADKFNKAMSQVASYQLNGLNLTFFDKNGKELVTFLKID